MSTAIPVTPAPGFARTRIGSLIVTTVSDGFLPIFAADMRDESEERIVDLLTDASLPPVGDLHTGVNSYLFDSPAGLVLVDAGAGTSLGPDTGHLVANLETAGISPEQIDHVLITHMHPDHLFGLLTPDAEPAFPSATVHVATGDADHWLDHATAAGATGVQAQIHRWAMDASEPYRASGRFSTFNYGSEPVPGVTAVDLRGHTPGHTGYLIGTDSQERLLLWGDTMHSHSVQLRAPHVTMDIDSDRSTAGAARQRILDQVVAVEWMVGGSHLPFPGLGHVEHRNGEYVWMPA
jgi:glyoxylase-like metal-dependent hydrolase (beta-lactamase superfamily II)